MLTISLFTAIALVAARLGGAGTVTLMGYPAIVDGDTLKIAGTRIRLEGVDAPELGQKCGLNGVVYACGQRAREALGRLADGGPVTCHGRQRDKYGRLLAVCSVPGGQINARLVELGWAVAYGGYEMEEGRARRAKAGLWAGTFDRPHDWRAINGGVGEIPAGLFRAMANWFRLLVQEWTGNEEKRKYKTND